MTEKEKLLDNLVEKSGKEKNEIETLVTDKVNELSGLVSEEGAIYIVANELGIKLDSEKPKREANLVKIEEVTEPKTPVSCVCKVLKKYDKVTFSTKNKEEGSVQSLLVGDETGITRIVFWNDKVEELEKVNEKDIIKVINAFTRENQNTERIEIHYGQYSDLEVNPEGYSVEVKEMPPIELVEKKVSELEEGTRNVKLTGLITDFDIPRYYLACPHTFKKVFQDEGKYLSPSHGEVDPIKVPIINCVVDDGTGSIQLVGFRDRAEELTGSQTDDLIKLTEDIDKYKEFSKKIVGSQVEIVGNVSENNMTGDKQVIVNQVLNIEFKSVDDLAKELAQEDTQSKDQKPKEEKTSATQNKKDQTSQDDDMDLDIEEIDIDDDLL